MDNCLERLYELLAAELNCSAGDFTKKENVLTVSALNAGRRAYSPERYFFHMATTGRNAVITADERLHGFLAQYKERCEGYRLFTLPELAGLSRELEKYGYRLTETYHMFLPCRRAEPQRDYAVRWFTGEELRQFYGDSRFPNALCPQYTPERPDTAAVCAYDGEEIMGMAGCSEDAKGWQQIGVDVMPQYRSMGVGTYLVTLLKNRIEDAGDIAFYGTGVSNYHSWNIAINSGFRPAWLEIGAERACDKV